MSERRAGKDPLRLTSVLDALSISWHSSRGNSSNSKDPFSCVYESENARLNSAMMVDRLSNLISAREFPGRST